MTDVPFKVGDTVRLKSGGPLMTVAKIVKMAMGNPDEVAVVWFDGSNKMVDRFIPELLEADDGSPVIG
jgi:uncharacterized protein YodC (DUF2158 family)